MYFSEEFRVELTPDDDWFDRLLKDDTRLFIDPFLMYAEESRFWAGSADQMAGHFERGFKLLTGHQDNPGSLQYGKTIDMMLFPEPAEIGLGFVDSGTDGSGGGRGLAKQIVRAMKLAIERGLADLRHFEELGVLVDKIGRDRISDITCNIMKSKFIEYTQDVCRRHDIPMESFTVRNASFDEIRGRWSSDKVELPKNPASGGAIILVPKRFLRELPTLGSDDWWDYLEPTLRNDLNLDIMGRLPKAKIVNYARQYPEWVRAWTNSRDGSAPDPYDVDRDPEGLYAWRFHTRDSALADPIETPSITPSNLMDFISKVNEKFRHFVEQRGGWELLYNEDTHLPRREPSIQLLYRGVVESYCEAHGVRLDREVNLGRGPVDFLFTDSTERVLMELKKLKNGKFWNGLDDQLISYIRSEENSRGWLVAVRFSDTRLEKNREAELPRRTRSASANSGYELRSVLVDARRKLSASLLDGGDDSIGVESDPEFPDEN